MSMAKTAGVFIGVIVAATAATAVEAGDGKGRKRYRDSPVYIVEQPVIVQRSPVYVVPPPPVVYAPAPTYYEPMYQRYDRYDRYPSSPSVNINIPLR
jgi:hypothetical protein